MEKQIRPVFTLDLNYKIIPGLVAIGKYDGTHPCITAATTADKILVHSPHRRKTVASGRLVYSETNREIATLNINQSITAITCGIFLPDDDKDVLIVGTASNVMVYHVHENKSVFYKECQEGVKALALGPFREKKTQTLLVGSNSSIHGYDYEGTEIFWTAMEDVTTSIILMDYNKDGLNEVIVSSEDYKIRVFVDDVAVNESLETEIVTTLISLPENRFAYAVSNGTIGVYEQEVRIWRVKSKHFAISFQYYDLLGQGSPQLMTGWSNGKLDCRSIKTGEVLFKDTVGCSVAGIVEGDYRSMGKSDIITVSTDGEVRGYTAIKSLTTSNGSTSEQDIVREMMAQKQALIMELKHYESNTKYNISGDDQMDSFENQGVIPANTRLQIGIAANDEKIQKSNIEIYIATNNNTVIRVVTIFAEGIFKGETYVLHPEITRLSSEVTIPLHLPKDNPVDIHIKVLVGYPKSLQFHVFEITRQLPRFCMYALVEHVDSKPSSYVEFMVNERLQRICMWFNQNFLLTNEMEVDGNPILTFNLHCLRDKSTLVLVFETNGKVTIHTESITLAADLVQSLSTFLKVNNLESKVNFPKLEETLKSHLSKLSEIYDAGMHLGTDVADGLAKLRSLLIRGEDSRLNDMKEMPSIYNELNILVKELKNGHHIRMSNYHEGLDTVKEINSIIQRTSRLRAGENSSSMINLCRICIQNNNIEGLLKIIRTGTM